jgi:hypothetical protein
MKRFAGRWLLAVAVIHTAFALLVFHAELLAILRAGFVDAIGEDPTRAAVAWFTLFGGVLAAAAVAVDELEQRGAPLRRAGLALLPLVILGLLWMPASGLWLVLPAIAFMVRSRAQAGMAGPLEG